MGSGTTAKVAHLLKRRWIGSEVSAEYVAIARERLAAYTEDEKFFAVK
jgi:site-specific DNA-methyltransferase (adenine-specific)